MPLTAFCVSKRSRRPGAFWRPAGARRLLSINFAIGLSHPERPGVRTPELSHFAGCCEGLRSMAGVAKVGRRSEFARLVDGTGETFSGNHGRFMDAPGMAGGGAAPAPGQ